MNCFFLLTVQRVEGSPGPKTTRPQKKTKHNGAAHYFNYGRSHHLLCRCGAQVVAVSVTWPCGKTVGFVFFNRKTRQILQPTLFFKMFFRYFFLFLIIRSIRQTVKGGWKPKKKSIKRKENESTFKVFFLFLNKKHFKKDAGAESSDRTRPRRLGDWTEPARRRRFCFFPFLPFFLFFFSFFLPSLLLSFSRREDVHSFQHGTTDSSILFLCVCVPSVPSDFVSILNF